MLSPKSAAVVKETLPVVGAAIEDITTRFYATLFADHPALERDLFNQGNQAQGDQQRALAGAIASFATLLVAEDAPPPDKVLSRIANKHASLGVTGDQYQLVHDYLFAAIVAVLGDVVTEDVAAAWDEVWLAARVVARGQESPDCIALTLTGVDTALPEFAPGQYTSVGVVLAGGARQIRQRAGRSGRAAARGDHADLVRRDRGAGGFGRDGSARRCAGLFVRAATVHAVGARKPGGPRNSGR